MAINEVHHVLYRTEPGGEWKERAAVPKYSTALRIAHDLQLDISVVQCRIDQTIMEWSRLK